MNVHLVDGTYELFRSYYGAPPADGRDGQPVGAIRGIVRSMLSLLHEPGGSISLAPLYDVMCTTHYDGTDGLAIVDTELGLHIGGRTDIKRVTIDDFVNEARRWGMRDRDARRTLAGLVERIPAAIDAALIDVGGVPEAIVARARARTLSLR